MDDHDDALARSVREAEELLEIEEADAWFEYLEAIRNLPSHSQRYQEVEPWAYARLSTRVRALKARRSKLREVA